MNQWTKALQEALEGECDKVPKGCVRFSVLMKTWGCSRAVATSHATLLESKGKLERIPLKIMVGGRKLRIIHYRLL